jgi:predicted alpha/beta-fold hydrolase
MSRSNQTLWLLLALTMLLASCQPISPAVSQPASGTADATSLEATAERDAPQVSAETVVEEQQASEDTSGFVDRDGVRIHYEVVGNGPPLVLAHWWTGSTEDWHLFGYVDGLKDYYRLILVDMRGHGQSDKPHDAAAYTPQILANDVIAVLDDLGIEQANFF